jgi:SAM-dependent methyltransferase
MNDASQPRWFTEFGPGYADVYAQRFRDMIAAGKDIDGEARMLDALLERRSRVLDAGCGTGRVGAALFERGHVVTGVDVDADLIALAQRDYPGPRWQVADLAELDLGETFDAAVLAGNVLVYVAPGSEHTVLARVAQHVRANGVIVLGFATDRPYTLADLDRDCAQLGLPVEHRFATWDLRPWRDDADWAVTVLRKPAR